MPSNRSTPRHRKKKKSGAPAVLLTICILCLLIVAGTLVAQRFLLDKGPGSSSVPVQQGGVELGLDQTEITLYEGYSAVLHTVPEGTPAVWSSDNEAVARVDGGTVRAAAPGTAVIRAYTDSSEAFCTVTVLALPKVTVENPSGQHIDETKLQTLRELTAQAPLTVSVYYKDLVTGTVIEYNSGKKYAAGSVIKAPYCKWLLASGADLEERLTFTSADILEGSGSLKDSPEGTAFTVRELADKALRESDNTAYHMLVKRFGFDGFLGYAQSLGVGANQSSSNLFGNMSAVGAGIYFQDIYYWSQGEPERGQFLKDALCNTTYRKLISSAVDAPVAHKYGYNNGTGGFHDAAIVYRDRPYVLTIFTYLDPDVPETVPYIQSLAACLDSIHTGG